MANWDVFQRVPSRVQSPVIFLSSFDYGMFISFLALFSTVRLRLMPYVRACFVFMCIVQLLIPIQASLWAGPANSLCQLFIIIFANIFLATRLVHLPFVQADSIPIPNFQYLQPNKKSHPGSHAYILFYHGLCVRYDHRSGHYLDEGVRISFSCRTV